MDSDRNSDRKKRDLSNRSVLLVASGPSLEKEDIEKARKAGFFVVACNDNHDINPDVLYSPDINWIKHYNPEHPCKWTVSNGDPDIPGWNRIPIEKGSQGRSHTEGAIANHGHAGAQMLSLVVDIWGARRVALTGYDMQPTGGNVRRYGKHPVGIEKGLANKFSQWRDSMAKMARELTDIEIVNCTRETALTCFPCESIDEVIERWTSDPA